MPSGTCVEWKAKTGRGCDPSATEKTQLCQVPLRAGRGLPRLVEREGAGPVVLVGMPYPPVEQVALVDQLQPLVRAELEHVLRVLDVRRVRRQRALRDGQRAGPRPALTFRSAPGFLQIHDARHPGRGGTHTFEGDLAEIYLACTERPVTVAGVLDRLPPGQAAGSVEFVEEAVAEFARRGLMFRDGTLAVALALPAVGGR